MNANTEHPKETSSDTGRDPQEESTGPEDLKKQSVLGLLGLARRAGALQLGSGPVVRALREESPGIVFLARDAGGDLVGRIERVLGSSHLDHRLLDGEDLARAFGRQRLSVVSVHDSGFVAGLMKHVSDTR